MEIETVKEICGLMCDQLQFQASNSKSDKQREELEAIADLLNKITRYGRWETL